MHDSAIKAGMKIIMVLASISEFLFTLNDTWQEKNIPPPTTMGCFLWMSWMKVMTTTRSHWKQLLVNERALKYIFKDKSASYQDLLQGIRPPSMETPKNPGHAIDNKQ